MFFFLQKIAFFPENLVFNFLRDVLHWLDNFSKVLISLKCIRNTPSIVQNHFLDSFLCQPLYPPFFQDLLSPIQPRNFLEN